MTTSLKHTIKQEKDQLINEHNIYIYNIIANTQLTIPVNNFNVLK